MKAGKWENKKSLVGFMCVKLVREHDKYYEVQGFFYHKKYGFYPGDKHEILKTHKLEYVGA